MVQGSTLVRRSKQIIRSLDALSEMEWRHVYSQLGMLKEFQEFASTGQLRLCGQEIDRWSIPVAKGLDCDSLVVAHRSLGVKVCFFNITGHREDPERHFRDPANGSYQVDVNRSFSADIDLRGICAVDLDARELQGCTILEYLLLSFALHCRGKDHHLDSEGTVTICSGSRMNDRVAVAEYDKIQRRIQILWVSQSYATSAYGAREVFPPLS